MGNKKNSNKDTTQRKETREGSIIILNAPKGAEGYGHLALMVKNRKGLWEFVSKEGRQKNHWYSPKGKIGEAIGAPALPPLIQYYLSWQDFRNAQQNSIYAKNLAEYSEAIRLFANDEQDSLALRASEKSASSYYHALYANCADATSDGLAAARLNPGYEYYLGRTGFDSRKSPFPNIRFADIIRNNADKIDTSFHPFDTPVFSNKLSDLQNGMVSYNPAYIQYIAQSPLLLLNEQELADRDALSQVKTERNASHKLAIPHPTMAPSIPLPFVKEWEGAPGNFHNHMHGSVFSHTGELYNNGSLKVPGVHDVSHKQSAKKSGGGVVNNITVQTNDTHHNQSAAGNKDIYNELVAILTSAVSDSKIGTDVH